MLLNGLISSSKQAISSILGRNDVKGQVVVLAPGGAEEALESHPNLYNVVLRERKGFIRLALKYGADIVPCYHFGEQKLFNQWPNPPESRLRNLQRKFKRLTGATPPIFWGKCIFDYFSVGVMPFRRPIISIVGAPLHVEQKLSPSEEEINELHDRYCTALKRLFDEYKLSCDDETTAETQLKIV